MNPIKPCTIACFLLTFPNAVEDGLDDCLLLGNSRKERVGVAEHSVEFARCQCVLPCSLGAVESLEGDLTGMVENEGGLNK